MNDMSGAASGKRLLYVVTEDWYFMSHRLPMARAARDAGWKVHVATRISDHAEAMKAEGFSIYPLHWRRRNLSPLSLIGDVLALRRLYKNLRPKVVHHVALKPTLVGNLASVGLHRLTCVNSLAGLGYVFTSRHLLARALRFPVKVALGVLLNRATVVNIVQNPDDREALMAMDVSAARIELIPGSGVDVRRFVPRREPAQPPIRIGFVGRMLEDKGVRVLIDAHRRLKQRGLQAELLLAGTPDPDNPTSIAPAEIAGWALLPGVTHLGQVTDIDGFWAGCHIAVLPSRREGLPMSLLEAAACGKPVVATDVPGCREIAIEGINALLVPPDDPAALADALEVLGKDYEKRRMFGMSSRRMAEQKFSSDIIGEAVVALYNRSALVTGWMNA